MYIMCVCYLNSFLDLISIHNYYHQATILEHDLGMYENMRLVCYSYSTGPGIYGSKPTESEGAARGQGLFTLP